MRRKPRFAPSQVEHMEGLVAEVERRRSRPFTEADAQRLLERMRSPDETTRLRAVREICPCRIPWEQFDRLRKAAKQLQKDPSPLVRANALHVEQDAREVASVEAMSERYREYREIEEDRRAEEVRRFRRGGMGRR